ncbi:MAG: cupin domain-containing protein [Chitinophagales bacterium]|nr:cupin domain-containing protein [Chitinophagales bacterium]
MTNRTIYNPLQKDSVTFLKVGRETNGEYTLVKVELANMGGVGLHYHKTYAETFTCLEGQVQIKVDERIYTLSEGQTATAHPLSNHLFQNRSGNPCQFTVEIRPAHRGFEETLQIAYGLARDGKCGKNGMPKNILVLAWLFIHSESNLRGWRSLFEPLLKFQAGITQAFGLHKKLILKYVKL